MGLAAQTRLELVERQTLIKGGTIMKHGFQILDADLHVIEPYDLYLKYMDPKWGD